jgi:leader peptidase (prepilin peptidase) / N-methyltransferase
VTPSAASAFGAIGFGLFGLLGGLILVRPLTTKAYLRTGDVSRRAAVSRGQVLWQATLGAAMVGGTTAPSQPWLGAVLLVISIVAVWVSVVDVDVHRIPNRASLMVALTSLTYVVIDGAITPDYRRALSAVVAGVAAGVVGFGVAWLGGVGLGDVKLLAALVPVPAYLGWGAIAVTAVALALGGVVAGLLSVGKRQLSTRLPAGPVIALGFLMGVSVWVLLSGCTCDVLG